MDGHQVYNEHFTRVYRYFHYRELSPQDSEDLCHEVFLRFYQKYLPEQLDSDACIKILYRISSFVIKEHYRKPITDILYEDSVEDGTAGEPIMLTFEEFAEAEDEWDANIDALKEELYAAIDDLGEKVAAVIRLRFIEEKTRKETADALSLSEDTVHTYQKRGVATLKKRLNEKGIL